MTGTVSLPPSNSTPFERAFSLACADQPRLPVHLLATLYDPWTCPAQLLPYLAWAFSVDIWKDEWSETKKRAVIAATPRLHRLKATKPGLEKHLEIVGARLLGLRRPPDKFFPGPSLTKEEYEAWLSRFRQLRVYSYRSRGSATFQAYLGMGLKRRGLFASFNFFPARSDAVARIGRRAFLFDPLTGIEEPIVSVVRERMTEEHVAVRFEQFKLRGKAHGFFPGAGATARIFLVKSSAAARLYTMEIRQGYDHATDRLRLAAVTSSLTPIDVRPRRVAEAGAAAFGQFFPAGTRGKSFLGTGGRWRVFLPPSSAYLRIYDQVHLHERGRSVGTMGRATRAFLSAGRHLGLPAHTLIAKVDIRGKRPRCAFGRFMRGFLVKSSQAERADAHLAARVSKAAYERLLVTTRTMRPAIVGDRLKLGTIRVGQWIKT